MSDCCSAENKNIHALSPDLWCPHCKEKGKPVDIMTLKSLLAARAMKRLEASGHYQFCRQSGCPVAYFSNSVSFLKDEITVPIFQKEDADATPVCYCFGYNKKNLMDDVVKNGKSTIKDEITRYVKENKCACEMRNPQGSCCLGNVSQVIKAATN